MCCDGDRVTAARFGLVATVSTPCVMVIVAEADFVGSLIEVAVRVTVAGFGMFAGALKVTDDVVTVVRAPHVLPLHPAPESAQVVPAFLKSFCVLEVKACVP